MAIAIVIAIAAAAGSVTGVETDASVLAIVAETGARTVAGIGARTAAETAAAETKGPELDIAMIAETGRDQRGHIETVIEVAARIRTEDIMEEVLVEVITHKFLSHKFTILASMLIIIFVWFLDKIHSQNNIFDASNFIDI